MAIFVNDPRPVGDESFGAVPRLRTFADIRLHVAQISIDESLGWTITPVGVGCWKCVGFHVTVARTDISPLVWQLDGTYLPNKWVQWYYTGAPFDRMKESSPRYFPRAFEVQTKDKPDNDGAHFVVSGDHNVAPGVVGPDSVWVKVEPNSPQYADAVHGLGMRVNTNHLIVSPVFQHVIKMSEIPPPDPDPDPTPPTNWHDAFNERQLKEIEYCRLYAERFNHGTDGHNIRLIVAKMAELLDAYQPGG